MIFDALHSSSLAAAILRSLLPTSKVPRKMIQDWLGHSDIQTTANIYSHLDAQSKQESARRSAKH